ncbi:MAG: DUF4384 domain-containing protein [Methylococcales bacterium]|nr:DUF4384 domain-containing protein [Methylococcales bacterium]
MKNKILPLIIAVLTSSCGLNPQNVDIDLQETLPETKYTVFSQSLGELGRLNKIFGQGKLKVMVKNIVDNTGTSLPTQGEIPSDITEMLKSSLNGVGGNIFYIPYDPSFMLNTAKTGYSTWGNKELPDIILSGGITEFDRAMVSKGENSDLGVDIKNSPFSFDLGDQTKSSLASITLDFNLIDFSTFTGIPHMQAINNIKVHKGLRDDSLGFTIYGASIGVKGTMKKIQGRHAATRLLVQLSLIQVLGRYQRLPYWKLLPGTQEDAIVINLLTEDFYALSQKGRIAKTQEYLILLGKDVDITGSLDSKTITALTTVSGTKDSKNIGVEQFLEVFRQIPIDASTLGYRSLADSKLATYRAASKPTQIVSTQSEENTKNNNNANAYATPNQESLKPGSITLTTNQSEFNINDYLVISFTVDKPMYVRLVTVNSEGKIANLFPNPYQPDNYLQPGRQYQIPPKNAEFTLKVRGPAGTDKIRAIAGMKPVTAEDAQLNLDGSFKTDPSSNNLTIAERDIVINKQVVAGK